MLRPSDCSAVQLGKGRRNGETEWCLTLNLWKSDLKWARCSSRDWNTARQPWQFQDCSSNSSAPTRAGASSATGNDSSLSWSCNPCNPNPKSEGGRGAVAWSRWVKRSAPSKKPGGAVKSVGASDGAMAATKQRSRRSGGRDAEKEKLWHHGQGHNWPIQHHRAHSHSKLTSSICATAHAHHDPNTSITKLQSQSTIAENMHQCTLEAYTGFEQRNLVRFARIVPEYHLGIIQVSSRLLA